MSIGPAFGVGVSANILASAQVLSQRWHLQPRRRNYVVGFGECVVSGGGGNRSSNRVSVLPVPGEAHYVGSCYDIREPHEHLCANVDACPFDCCLPRELWQNPNEALVRDQIVADPNG